MAKFRNINWKSKTTWKNILVIGLAIITLIGAIVGISALFRKSEETTKEINPSWAIGGLTEQGAYLETKESIYTKDAFGCQGLNIKIDFDNNISYRVFFYDYNDDFVSSTNKLTANYNEDISPLVKSARIVITPKEDSKISWYEKSGYAKQLSIYVDKVQSKTNIADTYSYDLSTLKSCGYTIVKDTGLAKASNTYYGSYIYLDDYKDLYSTIRIVADTSDGLWRNYAFLTTELQDGIAPSYASGTELVITKDAVTELAIPSDAKILYVYNVSDFGGESEVLYLPSEIIFVK